MSLSDPQSFNRYSYVGNDPVNFIDPSGLNASSGAMLCQTTATTYEIKDNVLHIIPGQTTCYQIGGGGGINTNIGTRGSIGIDPMGADSWADLIAEALSRAVDIYQNGCYYDRLHPDVSAKNDLKANLANSDNYAKNWASAYSAYNNDAKESDKSVGSITVAENQANSTIFGRAKAGGESSSQIDFRIKIYPGNAASSGAAVTYKTSTPAHYASAVVYYGQSLAKTWLGMQMPAIAATAMLPPENASVSATYLEATKGKKCAR